MNLSFSDKEFFYKVEKINKDNLTLISLQDNSEILFIRVGAKLTENKMEKIESENEVKNQKPKEDGA